jgi:hypothetical protein
MIVLSRPTSATGSARLKLNSVLRRATASSAPSGARSVNLPHRAPQRHATRRAATAPPRPRGCDGAAAMQSGRQRHARLGGRLMTTVQRTGCAGVRSTRRAQQHITTAHAWTKPAPPRSVCSLVRSWGGFRATQCARASCARADLLLGALEHEVREEVLLVAAVREGHCRGALLALLDRRGPRRAARGARGPHGRLVCVRVRVRADFQHLGGAPGHYGRAGLRRVALHIGRAAGERSGALRGRARAADALGLRQHHTKGLARAGGRHAPDAG